MVKKLAYELRRLGVSRGDIVALDLPDQLGILFTEAAFHEGAVTTIIPDGWTPEGDLQVGWLFTSRGRAAPPGATAVDVDQAFLQGVEENPYGISPTDEPFEMLRIIFSSGTTGMPKAIPMGTPAARLAAAASLEAWSQGLPHLMLMDTGTAWGFSEFTASVRAGVPYLALGGAPQADIVRIAEQNAVQSVMGSPAQVAALVEELEAQQRTLPTIQAVMTTGTVMPPGIADRMRKAAEGCMIFALYGSTEAGGATTRQYESDDPYDAGQILPGTTVEIVDDDDEPVAEGVVGRIRYRSFAMADRYLGNPDASARAFKGGWFYPGDLGSIRPDGGLSLAGRDSEVLNAGGVKVDPNRLDHFALQNPKVKDASSFEYEASSGVPAVGIALVADDDLDVDDLIAHLKAEFSTAAPTLVARVDAIPKTRTGKPIRHKLAETYKGS